MRISAIYIIECRDALRSALEGQLEEYFIDLVCEKCCVENPEGGKTAWTKDDHTAKVKLQFLAEILEYSGGENWPGILGEKPGIAMFDRWWEIERFQMDWDAEQELNSHLPEIKKWLPTGSELLDAWVRSFDVQGDSND